MNHRQLTSRRTPRLLAFGALILGLLLAVASCAAASPRLKEVTIGPPRLVATATGMKLRPQTAVADQVLVRLSPTLGERQVLDVISKVHGRLGRHLGHGLFVLHLPTGSDVLATAGRLRAEGGVLSASPDLMMYPALVPNDPKYSSQYHLPCIDAPQAWDVTTGEGNVIIAVVDSGADLDHPDLAARIWTNPGEVPGNGLDDDHDGFVDDVHGWDFYDNNNDPNPSPDGVDNNGDGNTDEEVNHGTMVAGIAAATGNDGYGTAGITWGATIMPLQVFPDDGGTAVSTVIDAINFAVAHGANVINLSIGGGYTEDFTQPITDAYNAGVLVVSAGGNSSAELTDSESTWESPVCNDGPNLADNHVLGVGATDRWDRRASYSNFDSSSRSFIDIMAPGDAIYAPAAYFPAIAGFNVYFTTNDGTSFSSPIASGLAALLKGHDPSLTPADLIALIHNNGDNIDSLNPGFAGKLGGGRLNCARALGITLPPAAVQDLSAIDTPDDNGGSITLSWRKSPDDGAGSDSVTQYLVFRRQGTGTPFSRVATLDKGTESLADTGVTDGVSYYYKVRATDGTLFTDTAPQGPVQSRNDLPPPALTGVTAYDRPADSGGAIIVAWDPFTVPADFDVFAIYRSTSPFSSVLGRTPLATLSNSDQTTYVDPSATTGVNYYYAVGARDTFGNEVRTLASVGPVQSFSNDPVSFGPGLYFMAAPAVPADHDPATLLGLPVGSFPVARWSPDTGGYMLDSGERPLPDLLQVQLGRGFWVRFDSAVSIDPAGTSAPAGDLDIDLTPGWHQLGNPFFAPLNFGDSMVTYQGATMDLASADAAGVLAAFAWAYDTAALGYELVYPSLDSTPSRLAPWRGMWVLAYKSCRLTLARPTGTASAGVASAAATSGATVRHSPAWQVQWSAGLRVRSGSTYDSTCFVGAASQEILAPKPPPAESAPVLTLAAPGQQRAGKYAISLAQSGQTNIIWNMKIENLRPGQPVEITAPDLSRLPTDTMMVLEDLSTTQSVYLRTVANYRFTPREGETERSFRLTVAPRSAAALSVQGLVAQAGRGGSAAVSFTLSAPAATTVTILNLAGRPVRVLEEGKPRPAGNNQVLWDGRSGLGTSVPAGMYLLQVTANAPSGQNVRAMSTLRLSR